MKQIQNQSNRYNYMYNIIGYILLIQISNKEKEVLNTYYLEARDQNYIDLKPTLDKFNNYGIIDLYIQIKVSTEKNKNNDESICQDVVWYSKEKIKKSKENINKLYQPRKIVTGRTLTIK